MRKKRKDRSYQTAPQINFKSGGGEGDTWKRAHGIITYIHVCLHVAVR